MTRTTTDTLVKRSNLWKCLRRRAEQLQAIYVILNPNQETARLIDDLTQLNRVLWQRDQREKQPLSVMLVAPLILH